jgi:hypothetical protein
LLLEVERYVEHILNTILKSKNLFQHSQFLIDNAKEHLIKSVDYVSYGMTDILDLGELDIAQCESLFATHGAAKEALIDVVKEFWKATIFFFFKLCCHFYLYVFNFSLVTLINIIRQVIRHLMKILWLLEVI